MQIKAVGGRRRIAGMGHIRHHRFSADMCRCIAIYCQPLVIAAILRRVSNGASWETGTPAND